LERLSGCRAGGLAGVLSRLVVAEVVAPVRWGRRGESLYSVTPRGVSASGTGLSPCRVPGGEAGLSRLHMSMQARVGLAVDGGSWVSRRVATKGMGVRAGGAPSGVLERDGGRWAVEVVVDGRRRRDRLRATVESRLESHDGVVCVCSVASSSWVGCVVAGLDPDRVEVRALSG
jgi:hypothetical protein